MPKSKLKTARKLVWIINGPNLNLVGQREPAIYGHESYSNIMTRCVAYGADLGLKVQHHQSNHEGVLIDWLHDARKAASGVIINAGGLSHTSIALMDAVRLTDLPAIEVHLSNIYQREEFRHHSLISNAAKGVICGLGGNGYILALDALASLLKTKTK
jgi:3-dehydroquinate dehydratase II